MTPSLRLKITPGAVALLFAGFCLLPNCLAEKPNVVFILADDLGVMDVGAFNPQTFYETPHLNRLAQEGKRFTTAYTACNVCSPTRYSVMTGKYPVRGGITNYLVGERAERFAPAELNQFMLLEEATLGEAFLEAGYRTAYLGKWHLGPPAEYGPQVQGFEIVRDNGSFSYVNPAVQNFVFPPRMQFPADNPPRVELRTEQTTRDALIVLEAIKEQPFFLFLGFDQPHSPIAASEEFIEPYRSKKERLGLQTNPALDFADEEQVFVTENKRQTRIRQNNAVYAGMINHMDKCVGRVLDKLDELGLADNTIVVFMTDNGGLTTAEGSPTSNLPFRAGKGWNYEGGLRGPLIVRFPGKVEANSVSDLPVISNDFYPTLLELCGLPLKPEQHRDCISFAATLTGKVQEKTHAALFWHYPHYSNQGGFPSSAIRVGDYKLILRLEDGRTHLYDLANDVGERNDLSSSQPDRVDAMKKTLFAWYADTGARFLRPKEDRAPWRP